MSWNLYDLLYWLITFWKTKQWVVGNFLYSNRNGEAHKIGLATWILCQCHRFQRLSGCRTWIDIAYLQKYKLMQIDRCIVWTLFVFHQQIHSGALSRFLPFYGLKLILLIRTKDQILIILKKRLIMVFMSFYGWVVSGTENDKLLS